MDKELAMNTLDELVADGNAPPEVIQELLELIMDDNENNMKLVKKDYLQAYEEIPEFFFPINMLYIPCQIDGNYCTAFVDTGAQVSIMSLAMAKKCGFEQRIDKQYNGIVKGVGEQKMVGKLYYVIVSFGDYGACEIPCSFIVLEDSPDIMIGINMMKCHRMELDFNNHVMKIPMGNDKFEIKFLDPKDIVDQHPFET